MRKLWGPGLRHGLGLVTPTAVAVALGLALAPGAAATTPAAAGRVALPDPTPLQTLTGTPAPLASAPTLTLRVYLAGGPGRAAAARAVSDPRGGAYGHYLTAAQFQRRYGATAAQAKTVSGWLTSQGMTVTATTPHYVAVTATVPEADAAFATTMIQYDFPPITFGGHQYPSAPAIGTSGGFSVPAALGGDIAAVTGLQFTSLPTPPSSSSPAAPPTSAGPSHATPSHATTPSAAATANSYHCSHFWGQHTEQIPEAYGRTSAPTMLCGYTPGQLRTAYGVSAGGYTGQGVTVAIVMNDSSPTMLSDANRFFTSHGLAGFAPGQFTVNAPASVAATCSGSGSQAGQANQDEPGGFDVNALEESIDVESVHITAPAAKVVYAAADCDEDPFGEVQDLLDAANRVVDQHLANVVSGSFSDDELMYSPADGTAWNLTFEQGAIEGIGFNLSSGDGGSGITPPLQTTPTVDFPSASPWDTAVGGTTAEIGRNGAMLASYPWGDNATQVNTDDTGYTSPPPGEFLGGGTGGLSAIFTEPAYQKPVVPHSLATGDGATRRVVPDISANAEGDELIGYTGAVTSGVYGQTLEGGTSAAAPLFTGLEADAIQAAGHPLGFVNPALYRLHGSGAVRDVPAVNPAHPPVVIGTQEFLGDGNNYLTTLGEDQAPLTATAGYDDATGLGTPGASFVTTLARLGR
jgi:subtilase family serine protease